MQMRDLIPIFVTVFLAELGDKTQLATLLFASEGKVAPLLVFVAAAGALTLSSAIAVGVGTAASQYLAALPLRPIAGVGFIAIGMWTLLQYYRG
jgi:putative Ca2+/H+ antiporter (TMEM165/GDT1 family)